MRVIDSAGDTRPQAMALLARAYVGLASSTYDTSADLGAAQALLGHADELADLAGVGSLRAAVRGQQALLLLRAGRIEPAASAFDRAVKLIDVAEPRDQIRILCNRGALALELGRLGRARADLSRAATIAAAEGDRLTESMVRHNLGYTEFLAGNLPRALSDMSDAAALAGGSPTPVFLLDRARVLREAGLTRDADAALAEAGELFRADSRGQDLGETELVRAECALVEGHSDRARRLARSAVGRFQRRGNVLWRRRAELVLLRSERACDATSPAGLRALADRIEALVRVCEDEGRRDLAEAARLLLADTALAAGTRDADASSAWRLRGDDTFRTRLERREVRARLALLDSDRAAARREVRRGLGELTDHRARFDSVDLRTASAVHGLRLAQLGVGLALGSGRPGEVFESIERARTVFTRVPGVRPSSDPASAELLAERRRVEDESRALIGEPASAAERSRLRERVARLQRDIRARGWERDGGGAATLRPAGLGEARDAARGDGTALVSFIPHRE